MIDDRVGGNQRQSDGRQLVWHVQFWIDRFPDGDWYAAVKGEIDPDDDNGDDYCVLNEQRTAERTVTTSFHQPDADPPR